MEFKEKENKKEVWNWIKMEKVLVKFKEIVKLGQIGLEVKEKFLIFQLQNLHLISF